MDVVGLVALPTVLPDGAGVSALREDGAPFSTLAFSTMLPAPVGAAADIGARVQSLSTLVPPGGQLQVWAWSGEEVGGKIDVAVSRSLPPADIMVGSLERSADRLVQVVSINNETLDATHWREAAQGTGPSFNSSVELARPSLPSLLGGVSLLGDSARLDGDAEPELQPPPQIPLEASHQVAQLARRAIAKHEPQKLSTPIKPPGQQEEPPTLDGQGRGTPVSLFVQKPGPTSTENDLLASQSAPHVSPAFLASDEVTAAQSPAVPRQGQRSEPAPGLDAVEQPLSLARGPIPVSPSANLAGAPVFSDPASISVHAAAKVASTLSNSDIKLSGSAARERLSLAPPALQAANVPLSEVAKASHAASVEIPTIAPAMLLTEVARATVVGKTAEAQANMQRVPSDSLRPDQIKTGSPLPEVDGPPADHTASKVIANKSYSPDVSPKEASSERNVAVADEATAGKAERTEGEVQSAPGQPADPSPVGAHMHQPSAHLAAAVADRTAKDSAPNAGEKKLAELADRPAHPAVERDSALKDQASEVNADGVPSDGIQDKNADAPAINSAAARGSDLSAMPDAGKFELTPPLADQAQGRSDLGGLPDLVKTSERQHRNADQVIPVPDRSSTGQPAQYSGPVLLAQRPMGRPLAVAIGRTVQDGREQLRISLDPKDLGQLDVRLSLERNGTLRAVVTASSDASAELLRQDLPSLVRGLSDAGLKVDGGSIRLEVQADAQGNSQHRQPREQQNTQRGPSNAENQFIDEELYAMRPLRAGSMIELRA